MIDVLYIVRDSISINCDLELIKKHLGIKD